MPGSTPVGYDPAHIVEVSLQLHTGNKDGQLDSGPVVFDIDSFSIGPAPFPRDAAAD